MGHKISGVRKAPLALKKKAVAGEATVEQSVVVHKPWRCELCHNANFKTDMCTVCGRGKTWKKKESIFTGSLGSAKFEPEEEG